MEPHREELRDHLIAALEAAPELPREDRAYLADVFLNVLDTQFDLIPRSTSRRGGGKMARQPRLPALGYWRVVAASFTAFLLWTTLWLAGPGWDHARGPFPPIFPLLVFAVIALRFWGPSRRSHVPR